MTPGSLAPLGGAAQYRRGAIMGLTVAEAFMLVAFILLMLLLLWRYAADEPPPPEPEEPGVPDTIANLPRDTLLVLESVLVRRPAPLAVAFIETAAGLSESDIGALRAGGKAVGPDALERLAATQDLSASNLAALRAGGNAVGPEELERLAATQDLSESELNALRAGGKTVGPEELERLAATQDLSESELNALRAGGKAVGPEELERLAATQDLSESDLAALRTGGKAVGPEELERLAATQGLSDADLAALRAGGEAVGPEELERLAATQGLSDADIAALRAGGKAVGPEELERLAATQGLSESDIATLRAGGMAVGPEALESLAATQGLSESELDALRAGGTVVGPEALERLAAVQGLSESEIGILRAGGKPVGSEELERLAVARDLSEAELDALRAGGEAVGPEELERLDALGERSAGEIADAADLKDALDPYGEYEAAEILGRIEDLMSTQTWVNAAVAEETAAAAELMRDLQTDLGPQIARAGGRLEPGGRIVFPEKFLFARGASGILPEFARILDDLCPTWLNTLKDSSAAREVETVLIEGHSSSEWTGAPSQREAWERNLELSQRRAQSVLVHCLNVVEGAPLEDWSRRKLAATGFSSSRPIYASGGGEDPDASRRVVFGVAFSREQFFETIRDGPAPAPAREGLGQLRGRAIVKDADTIGVDGYNVRLDGIDAFEKKQTCLRNDGTPWECGEEARRALEAHLEGKEVVCDRLTLGLGRFRGRCRADGENLNGWVVREGWAFAWTRFSDAYVGDENAARRAGRGAWSGEPPTPPWEWRRIRREGGS